MKIKDIMIEDVISVYSNTPIADVADILFRNCFHGVPVVEKNKVIGIITESDFFLKDFDDLYLPSYIGFLQENKVVDNLPKDIKSKISKLLDLKAKDLMTSQCLTVSPEMDISELMKLVKKTNFYTFPVADGGKNLVGIVTLSDVLGTIKGSSSEMGAALRAKKPREVDLLAKDTYSLWKQKFVFISKKRVQTWKGGFFITLAAALLAIAFWVASTKSKSVCNLEDKSMIPIQCQSFSYSDWSACRPDETQTRQVIERLPKGCEGGIPVLIQNCRPSEILQGE